VNTNWIANFEKDMRHMAGFVKPFQRIRSIQEGLAHRQFGVLPFATKVYFQIGLNFGDMLAPALVTHVTGRYATWVPRGAKNKLLSLGSFLYNRIRSGDVVWGTGSDRDVAINCTNATILAVRGPRTLSLLRECDVGGVAIGDPGSLMPQIYLPNRTQSKASVGLIPHFLDRDYMMHSAPLHDGAVRHIDIRNPDWRKTIDDIVSCDVVVSSSLHGIIVAEAYGVPAIWVQPTQNIPGHFFKFQDYFESTDRDIFPTPWNSSLSHLVARAEAPPLIDTSDLQRSADSITVALARDGR
jgi:pyruvyltransferase